MDDISKSEKKKSIFSKLNESLQHLKQMFQKGPENKIIEEKSPLIEMSSSNTDLNANLLNNAMLAELNKLKTLMPQSSPSTVDTNPKVAPPDPYLQTPCFIPVNAPNLNEIKQMKEEQKAVVKLSSDTATQPIKPKTTEEVRKEFLSELKRLKNEMKVQLETVETDAEEQQQMNLLKNEFMAELSRVKKSIDEEIKTDPAQTTENVENEEDWDDEE